MPMVLDTQLFQFLEPHHLHKASNHPIIPELMHHFYLQHLSAHKHSVPWGVEHSLTFRQLVPSLFSHYF